jgi:hypothetical protein
MQTAMTGRRSHANSTTMAAMIANTIQMSVTAKPRTTMASELCLLGVDRAS